jgi:Uma2 family endonuclease
MGLEARKPTTKFTYSDYLSWDDGERWEIIYGEAYNMSPAPDTMHQLISMELAFQLKSQLKEKSCQVIAAPFDVRLPVENQKENDAENVVQPDISVVCDPVKLDEKGCLGAPDLIIEILSPSTYRKDRMEKFFLYERLGVKEYWLVSPGEKIVEIFKLGKDGKYGRPDLYCESDTVRINVLNGLKIDLRSVFNINIGLKDSST